MSPRLPNRADLDRAFPYAFIALFALGFILRPTPVWALVFYLGVAPTFVAHLLHRRGALRFRDPAVVASLAMCLWFGATLLWGVNQTGDRIVKGVVATVDTVILVFAGFAFFRHAPDAALDRLPRWIALASAGNAVLSIILYFSTSGGDLRLDGWAETRHPILGANVMIVALVCAAIALRAASGVRERLVYAGCIALAATFVLLTGSRGPLLALLAAAAFLGGAGSRRGVLIAAAAAAAMAAVAWLALPPVRAFVLSNLARDPYRLLIWEATLEAVAERPFFGWGAAAVHTFGAPEFTFPHNFYLSALFYGGAVGLTLLVVWLGFALHRLLRTPGLRWRAELWALLCVPTIAGLTTISLPIRGPSELWYIIWLPILAIFGLAARARDGARGA